ncbi:hypothetical protein [Nocardia alba]|uniref:Uncharacterized protein n=1 Tax=Nocardia alba TaxID=225051 RepID=A0A4R1FMH8_9NOCA|nr:hypothetical protein [Nocardia alba]TCJ94519.1 hypothetical protein DFR71_5119 [Nocardia alba]
MASTSLPLAAAAAVATLLAAPAGAVPSDQPTTPATPAPAQPGQPSGEVEVPETPESVKPGQTKPGETKPGETKPTPAQPGVTSPAPGQPEQGTPAKPTPSQPGVTSPRVAPLPVPGQTQPAVQPERAGATPDQPGTEKPETGTTPSQPGSTPGQQGSTPGQQGTTPGQQQTQPTVPSGQGTGNSAEAESPETLVQEPKEPAWQAPRLANAPAAPVVEMEGARQEIGVTIDGAGVLANTHHYNNASGYVGTVGYRTPGGGFGDAGVSVEYVGANEVKVTTFNGGDGRADNTTVTVLDTTQANLAKAAVENWIKAQPGGIAALDAAAKATLPVPGELLQTVNVAGVNTQWGGSIQY